MSESHAAIALGSNLPSSFGDREANLREATGRVAKLGTVLAQSSSFDTEPVGFLHQPRFLNAALLLSTSLDPLALMRALLAIETEMGRSRLAIPAKGPRIIDLDLLWMENHVQQTPELTLPHPALQDRLFVLEPLAQIAPQWVHPLLGLSVVELIERLRPTKTSPTR